MSLIASDLTQLVGKTPLLQLARFAPLTQGRVLAKLENLNPGASVKDRIALAMIDDAAQSGRLPPGGTIIEPTSGNTGIGLAWIAAVRGYKVILTMPESMSLERRKLLQTLGAEIVLTSATEGMPGAVRKAEELVRTIPGSFQPSQFANPANPLAHYQTTGPEIWEATGGQVDLFVAGVGSGGTITGVGRFLREKNPQVQIIAVEPATSPVLSGGNMGSHAIQGIGPGFIPDNLDRSLLSEILAIESQTAIDAAKELSLKEGLLVGISAGANAAAARLLAQRPENQGRTIVTVLCDTGERYLSTQLFSRE